LRDRRRVNHGVGVGRVGAVRPDRPTRSAQADRRPGPGPRKALRPPQLIARALVALALVALVGACAAPIKTATGIVVAVNSSTIGSVQEASVRESDGTTLKFNVQRLDINNGLPAQHLREHLATGIPVVVEYIVEGDQNVALRYNDAPT